MLLRSRSLLSVSLYRFYRKINNKSNATNATHSMATSLATYSAFALNNRPATIEINRNGAVNFNGGALPATVGQHWIPSTDNVYDLGQNSTPLRWRDIWLSRDASVVGTVTAGALTVGGNAVFTNGPLYVGAGGLSNYNSSTPNIGATGAGRWGGLWCTTINTTGLITTAAINVTSLAVTGTQPAMFSGFLLPANSAALDLGSGALSWRDLYITGNIYKNGVLYNPAISSLGDLIPAADNTYNIGSGALSWKNIYFDGNITGGNLITTNGDIESATGNLKIYNGYGQFGTNVTVGATGAGNLTVSGSMIMNGNNQLRPATDNFGTVGTSALAWNNLYTHNGSIDILTPIVAGTPAPSTWVGTAIKRYQNGYIDNMNSVSVTPITDNTGTVGTAVLRYAAGYFNNLYLTALPISSFLASGQFAVSLVSTVTTPSFTMTPYTVSINTLTWTRVGSIYTMSLIWTIQLTSGWSSTAMTTYQLVFDLPVAMDAADGTRGGSCSAGELDKPTMFGATGYQGDSSFRLNFSNVTIPAISASGYASFRAIFQCKRTAA